MKVMCGHDEVRFRVDADVFVHRDKVLVRAMLWVSLNFQDFSFEQDSEFGCPCVAEFNTLDIALSDLHQFSCSIEPHQYSCVQ